MYSGTCITDLLAVSGRIQQELYFRVDQALAMSRMHREDFAVQLLEECMTHLSDSRPNSRYPDFDDGDRLAFAVMESLRDSMLPSVTVEAPPPNHLDWRTWLASGLTLGGIYAVGYLFWMQASLGR